MFYEWEAEVIFEPTGEAMTVYFGDEVLDGEDPMTEAQVIAAIVADISVVPKLVSA